jgi:hypothetical protein
MTEPANHHLPLIVSSKIIAQSADPLIGELTLTTDSGDMVLALTEQAAWDLIDNMASFLDVELNL